MSAAATEPRPVPLQPQFEQIPAALRDVPAWVMWRYEWRVDKKGSGKWTKPPRRARGHGGAKTNDPTTWADFEAARAAAPRFDGVGIVLTEDMVGIDLDHVFHIDEDGQETIEEWAQEVVDQFSGCYMERSPGGDGLHIICRGVARHSGKGGPENRCEVYDKDSPRYFTVTGHALCEGEVVEAQAGLDWLHATYFAQGGPKATAKTPPPEAPADADTAKADDAEAQDDDSSALGDLMLLDRARNAANGEKFKRLYDLGDGGPDASSNDAALVAMLAFWTQDHKQIDRLFRQSALMRPKWDEKRGATTYGERTISKILAMGGERYNEPSRNGTGLTDFYAYLPAHSYLYVPTRELWPAASVNNWVRWPIEGGREIRPSTWLDKRRAIEQVVWHPGEPEIIEHRVMQAGGWRAHGGARVFNLYLPPLPILGNPAAAAPWLDHVRRIYPNDADHIIKWLTHRIQFPGVKCNHAIVLGGNQGIGKDTILEPIKAGVGAWNWQEISPTQMLGRFNGWVKSVVLRVNEARDLGDVDRFSFYDHTKTYIAAPPDVLRVDEKNLREHYVANVMGVIITTNHKSDGLYLPADDRRHYVAWSNADRAQFDAAYWTGLYGWYGSGGIGHVVAYLRSLDLSDFDPKAPPVQTPAFWAIVQTGEAPESGELRDVLDHLGNPAAVTVERVALTAISHGFTHLATELRDRRSRRSVPHKFERVGYVPVRNPEAKDGMFKVGDRRQMVYARAELSLAEQIREARALAASKPAR